MHDLSLFSTQLTFYAFNIVNWVEKRLNSWVKMCKICQITLSADVLFGLKNVGRQHDFMKFWLFHTWIESFFNPIDFLCLKKQAIKSMGVEKRLNSLVKMSKICQITLSAYVLFSCKNVGRQHDFINFWHFHQWFESFFQPNWLFKP